MTVDNDVVRNGPVPAQRTADLPPRAELSSSLTEILDFFAARRVGRRQPSPETPSVLTYRDTHGVVRASLRIERSVPVVALSGPLDDGVRSPMLQALGSAVRLRTERVLLDLSVVAATDADVDVVECAHRFVTWHGAALDLACVPTTVLARLRASEAGSLISAHENVSVALAVPRRAPLATSPPACVDVATRPSVSGPTRT